MQITQSICIPFIVFITGGLMQCLALNQIIITEGDTLTLTCPVEHNTNLTDNLEWKTPKDLVMFFNTKKALKDKRIQLVKLTESEFTIRVTDITFKDGGVYKCLRYRKHTLEKQFKVIVLGAPKLDKNEQEDKITLKCSASANEHLPRLSWVMDNHLEFEAKPYYNLKSRTNKYTAISQLTIKVPKKRVTLKCVVYHLALHGVQLEDFIHFGNQIAVTETTESTSLNGTAVVLNNTYVNKTTQSTPITTASTPMSTSDNSSSTITVNQANQLATQNGKTERSTLLVLLVTSLIISLLLVLALFVVRLRRKYIDWKKENEDSDQSVESARSKSSNEEKQRQQRAQGFQNTIFSKYKAEESVTNEAQPTPALDISTIPQHVISKSCIKETDL